MIGHILKRCGIFLAIACIAACDAGFMNRDNPSSDQPGNFQKTLSDDTTCFSVERAKINDEVSIIKVIENTNVTNAASRCHMIFYTFSNGENVDGKLFIYALELFVSTASIEKLEKKCGIYEEYPFRFRTRVSMLMHTCPSLFESILPRMNIRGFKLGKFFPSNYHSRDASVIFNLPNQDSLPYMAAGMMEDEIHSLVPICLYNSDINGVNVDEFIRTGHLDYVEGCLFRYIDN